MLNLEVRTDRSKDEVKQALTDFFGEGGLGLKAHRGYRPATHFTGGGGFVFAYIREIDGKRVVELLAREWEEPVREFAAQIGSGQLSATHAS